MPTPPPHVATVNLALEGDTTQIHKEMTMDANLEGSSQQAKEDAINRRNGQGPKHLKFFLLVFFPTKAQA